MLQSLLEEDGLERRDALFEWMMFLTASKIREFETKVINLLSNKYLIFLDSIRPLKH